MSNKFDSYLRNIQNAIEEMLPNARDAAWQEQTFGALPESVTETYIAQLKEPCLTLIESGGKRWRPLLLVLCAQLASDSGRQSLICQNDVYLLSTLVEFVHTASLIHDDIEDSADTRRGKPAAHITYGLDTALNAGSWLYFHAATCIQKIDCSAETKNRIFELYARELRRLHLGQAMDIYWHRNPSVFPTEKEYKAMVQNKTGTLSSLAVQAGLLAGGALPEEIALGARSAALLGEGFQILDDVQNLTTGNPGKIRGDDIVEGKKSLPVILHIQSHPEDKTLLARLFRTAADEGIHSSATEQAIRLMESSGAIQEAFSIGKSVIEQSIPSLENLFETASHSEAAALIDQLFSEMIAKTGLMGAKK